MNIYFACSITGGREFEHIYHSLTAALLSDGHEVPTAHLAEKTAPVLEAALPAREVFERDVSWIRSADALLAEVSVPSHGVGFEIGFALSAEKPVLCLHQAGQKLSKMISGNPHSRLRISSYQNVGEAIELARDFIAALQ
jgi:2'-deoxynucleoside 5'-phosphate N-hydrolase